MTSLIDTESFVTPQALRQRYPLSQEDVYWIDAQRATLQRLIHGQDDRRLLIVGPCSIHDCAAAYDYALRLKALADKLEPRAFLVMRTYFEKPRTHSGWQGLLSDPYLDHSYQIDDGLALARQLLCRLAALRLPVATEFINPLTTHYLADLVSWSAVGARTVQSSLHRCMASGLPMPVGFKNSTSGELQSALYALLVAKQPQHFLSLSPTGQPCIQRTLGQLDGHLVLRGGRNGPNASNEQLQKAAKALQELHLPKRVLVDCAHGNSGKDPHSQVEVLRKLQRPNAHVLGFMLESFLHSGNQAPYGSELAYGLCVTDACLGWQETEALLRTCFN